MFLPYLMELLKVLYRSIELQFVLYLLYLCMLLDNLQVILGKMALQDPLELTVSLNISSIFFSS